MQHGEITEKIIACAYKPVGLILNFAEDKVEVKRKVKDL
jgi:hypothetical protein